MRASLLLSVCLLCGPLSLSALVTNEVVAFGLKHSVITNAEFSLDDGENPLKVNNTAICYDTNCLDAGPFGVSVFLQAADAGILVRPGAERIDGTWLEGTSYGTVGGVADSLIGSVKGTRQAYATYYVDMDFSPVGATSYTYQVYFHDLLTIEATNSGPQTFITTSGYEPSAPRVNPIWLKDGRAAVTVDFGDSIAEIYIPGYHVYASRVVITAETSETIERVSRLDVMGSSNLPWFTISNEQLGKFGLFHQALGGVHFGTTPSRLILSNVNTTPLLGADGMFTELPRVQRFEASLLPYTMTNATFSWAFSASGINSLAPQPAYIGEVRLSRTNSDLDLIAYFDGHDIAVSVYREGTFVGTATTTNGWLGAISGSNLVLYSYQAVATQTNEPAYIGFRMGNAVTFSNATGTTLTGDEFRVSAAGATETIGVLTSFALFGENLGEVTLTGMQTFTPPVDPLRLEITKSGNQVRVSWPYAPDYYLYEKNDLNVPQWDFVSGGGSSGYADFRSYLSIPTTNALSIFRLQHLYTGFLVTPGSP